MTEIIAAVAGIVGTIIVSIFTYIMARRAGIGPYQDTLVTKLKDLLDIQAQEIAGLKTENSNLKARVSELESKVEDLRELTINQALLIDSLTKARNRRKRTTAPQEEGDI